MAEQPMPKSPPGRTEFYAKRRHHAQLQVLENEIGFLEDELKSLEKVQPTSRCCREINDFIATKQDPLIDVNQKSSSSDSSCSWRTIRCCRFCRSSNEYNREARKSGCCSRENCCPNCCCIKCSSCLPKKCCFLKLCSKDCCKLKLCPKCVPSCSCC